MSGEQHPSHEPEKKISATPEIVEKPSQRAEKQTTKEAPIEKGENPDEAREAVEKALTDKEKSTKQEAEGRSSEDSDSPHRVISHESREVVFNESMLDIQKRMSAPSRAFSKVIHNPVVEDTSEVVGRTIARPTSILSGSACAFIVLLGVYLLAKHNGFALSGSEFIGVFILGWALGLLIDFFRHMVSGR
jgi:uncharacterized membrane protein YdbT with pleckstrin-like domain